MRIRLPKGRGLDVDRFAVVAILLSVAALAAFGASLTVEWDPDTFLVGWGANALVASMTGYVIYRMTGGSLASAPKVVRRAIVAYFWGGAWFLASVVVNRMTTESGWAAARFATNLVAPGVVVSFVLGLLFLVAGADGSKRQVRE